MGVKQAKERLCWGKYTTRAAHSTDHKIQWFWREKSNFLSGPALPSVHGELSDWTISEQPEGLHFHCSCVTFIKINGLLLGIIRYLGA